MDEPFGALDEITRHRLDSDMLELWQRKKLTVVFVTHSIYEAVYLSTRVVVMAARPGAADRRSEDRRALSARAGVPRVHRLQPVCQRLQDSLLRASGGVR